MLINLKINYFYNHVKNFNSKLETGKIAISFITRHHSTFAFTLLLHQKITILIRMLIL